MIAPFPCNLNILRPWVEVSCLAILSKGQLNVKLNILCDMHNYIPATRKCWQHYQRLITNIFMRDGFILTEEYIIINIAFRHIYKSKLQ